MNFEAVGGKGVILYNLEEVTRFEPVPMPVVEAFCAAAWITDISIEEDITFNVAANEVHSQRCHQGWLFTLDEKAEGLPGPEALDR